MSEHDPSRLGAYSLGALEPDEVREIDEHLVEAVPSAARSWPSSTS